MQDWNILTSRWVQMDVVDVDEDVRRLSANRGVTLAESVGGLALALSHKRDDALAFQSQLSSSHFMYFISCGRSEKWDILQAYCLIKNNTDLHYSKNCEAFPQRKTQARLQLQFMFSC